jgi:hypothetical protein
VMRGSLFVALGAKNVLILVERGGKQSLNLPSLLSNKLDPQLPFHFPIAHPSERWLNQ